MAITFKKKKKSIETTLEKLKRLRSNMLVHSYLYYTLDSPIISDDAWQKKAQQLVNLQKKFKKHINFYDKEFKDWDGSTGMHLPADSWVVAKGNQLLRYLK